MCLRLLFSLRCFFQANLQRVHRGADPRPISTGELPARAHPGAWDPGLPDSLQPHHTRVWRPRNLRCHDLPAELPERGAQAGGQNVPELRERAAGLLGRQQICREDGQAPEVSVPRTGGGRGLRLHISHVPIF